MADAPTGPYDFSAGVKGAGQSRMGGLHAIDSPARELKPANTRVQAAIPTTRDLGTPDTGLVASLRTVLTSKLTTRLGRHYHACVYARCIQNIVGKYKS